MTTLLTIPSHHFPLRSQPIRQKLLNFRPMTAEQPLHVQHTRPGLLPIPRRAIPPAHLPDGLPLELGQPQQTHRHPLGLAGALDGVPGPCPALLPTQPLFQVPEPILLTEPRSEQFHHLQPGQLRRRGHHGEPLLVALDPGDHRLDRHVGTRDPPPAHDLLPAHLPPATVEEGLPLVPPPFPPAALAGRRQPAAPHLIGTAALGQRGIQPGTHCSPGFSDLVSSPFSESHRCSIPTLSTVTLGLTITSGGRVEERRPDPAPGSDRRRLRPGRPRDDDLDLLPARRIEGRLSPLRPRRAHP